MSEDQTEETVINASPSPIEPVEEKPKKPRNMKPGAIKLRTWLNKPLRIKMSDGRVLIGIFLCTDRDANVILGSCSEYLPENDVTPGKTHEEPRMLGLVMVPGKHIVSVAVDKMEQQRDWGNRDENVTTTPLPEEVKDEDVT